MGRASPLLTRSVNSLTLIVVRLCTMTQDARTLLAGDFYLRDDVALPIETKHYAIPAYVPPSMPGSFGPTFALFHKTR